MRTNNSKVEKTEERYNSALQKRSDLFVKFNPCRVTSKLVTCRECGSKINREIFSRELYLGTYAKCPVCNSKTGLYSKTANDRIAAAEKKVKDTKTAYDKAKAGSEQHIAKSSFQSVLEETRNRLEIIYDEYKTPDYVQLKGEIGGDLLCFRVYRNGEVYEK